MKRALLLLAIALAFPAAADVVSATPRGVIVAHDGVVELRAGGRTVWSAPGLEGVTGIVTGETRIALLDAWSNRARIVSVADGRGTTFATAETPIDGVFSGDDLYLVARDSNRVEQIGGDGTRHSVAVSSDPAFLRAAGGTLYVYSRIEGVLQELAAGGTRLRVARELAMPPFASDMEIDGNTAYLIYPRTAVMVTANLDTFEIGSTVDVGGAPTDLAIARRGSALSAPLIAIADPSAKRLWTMEGVQSVGAAFARGFLRGLLGLGLFRPGSSDFPHGIDRVMARDGMTLAFDSTSGTLYRVSGRSAAVIAKGLDSQGFTISDGKIAYWRNAILHEVP